MFESIIVEFAPAGLVEMMEVNDGGFILPSHDYEAILNTPEGERDYSGLTIGDRQMLEANYSLETRERWETAMAESKKICENI